MPAATRRLLRFVVTAGLAVSVLSGCASTHDLHPALTPDDPDTLLVGKTFDGTLSSATWPAQAWWRDWSDPQLDALIAEALAGTPSLDAADARVRKAAALAGLADDARNPRVGANLQYSGAYLPDTLVPPPLGGRYQGIELATLNLRYAPDIWGGKRARWDAALGSLRATAIDVEQARLLLAGNIARSYVDLTLAYDARAVAEAERKRAAHLNDLAKQRVKAGLDNQLQWQLAESAVASATQQIQSAQQRIDVLRNAIAALLGQGPDRALAIDMPAMSAAQSPKLPSVIPSELLGHRPDVVAARWRVEAASRSIDAAKAEFYPSINLSATVGLATGKVSELFSSDAATALGGPAVSLPIFDGARLRAQLSSNDADYDLAVAQYNQTLVSALREVADAVQAARALDAQIVAVVQARDAAQNALKIADSRYRAGLGTQLDVLSAQRPLLLLDQQTAALRAQRRSVAIDLAVALGGGAMPASPSSFSIGSP